MPSLTPAPFIEEENILKFRKSTIDRRYKLRTQNIKINILAAPPSTSKNKKTIRKDKKPTLGRRNKFKSTKNKAGHKVLKLQNKDKTERNTEKHQKHIPVIEEESAPKSKKTTVGRRKYSRTKVTKVIPEGAVRTKRKYIRSMKYTNKAKALLTKKSKKVKIVTENTVVEKIVTDDQIDSVKDILSLNESLSKQKFPRIKHSNVSYYQVCKIGFAETPKGIVFKCFTTNCKFQSYDECIFKSHLNSFHCNSVTVTSEQYCAFCKELFSSSSVLSELEHINKKHLKYASIKNNMVLPLATVDSMHINVELPSIDIEKNSVDNIELPSEVNNNSSPTESDKSLVQESLLEDQIQSTVIHSINNLQSLESKIGFEIISDDELSSNSSVLTNETKLSAETTVIQELSDISSDEDSVFNDYLEKKESCTFDFNDISSDESIRSYKTVSSKSARIKKILNNPDIIVQKILNENKRKQTLNRKYCSKKSKQTEMPKVVRRSKLPTQVSVQIPTQVPVQVPTQMIVQVPNKSPVQTQFKVTVQSPIEIRPTIVMNKLNIQILQPWIAKRPNFKYEVSCTNMLQKNALFAFYKCMGFTCSYHTSSENLFFCHLRLHQQNHLCDYPDTYLFCSYCPQSFEKIEKLMKHIKEVHQHDKYQCSHCFYRSCEMQSLSVHMKIYHDNQHSKTALHCETIDAPIDVDGMFEKLIENRLKYVAPLRCKGLFVCFLL